MERVQSVEPREGYRLFVVFEPLRDLDVFAQVPVDEFGAVCRPNGADLAPDGLYARLQAEASKRK